MRRHVVATARVALDGPINRPTLEAAHRGLLCVVIQGHRAGIQPLGNIGVRGAASGARREGAATHFFAISVW